MIRERKGNQPPSPRSVFQDSVPKTPCGVLVSSGAIEEALEHLDEERLGKPYVSD